MKELADPFILDFFPDCLYYGKLILILTSTGDQFLYIDNDFWEGTLFSMQAGYLELTRLELTRSSFQVLRKFAAREHRKDQDSRQNRQKRAGGRLIGTPENFSTEKQETGVLSL